MNHDNRTFVSENAVGEDKPKFVLKEGSYINGLKSPRPPKKQKKGGKTKIPVILLVFTMILSSLVVLTYEQSYVASNGFDLGLMVPYVRSYNPSLIEKYKFMGYVNGNQEIGLVIGFKWKNEEQLNETLAKINDPESPEYHHYLTWDVLKKNYAPDKKIYDATVQWLRDNGVHISHTWPLRNAISIVDKVNTIEKVFNTRIGVYKGDGVHTKEYFYATTKPLELPGNIIPYINGISGTNNAPKYHLNFHTSSSTGVRYVFASDLQKMYHVVQLYNNSASAAPTEHPIFAKGLRIATVLWEGSSGNTWNSKEAPPFDPADIYHYWDRVIPTWEQKAGGMSHVWGYGTESDCVPPGPDTDTSGTNGENELDLEMIGVLAPGVDVVCVYSDSSQTNFPADNYNYILSYLAHNSTLVAVSNSWGGGDSAEDSTTMADVQALNALGVTVLASSGDDATTTSPSKPSTAAYDNYGFVAVGATSPIPNGDDDSNTSFDTDTYQTMGNNTDLTNPRSGEVVWWDKGSGSGGQGPGGTSDDWGTQSGISSTYSEPTWQKKYVGTYSGRVTADVSADGNRTIIYTYGQVSSSSYGNSWFGIAGTSVACPVTAGILGTMAAYAGRMYDGQGAVTGDTSIYGFGFFAPTIYMLGYDYYHNGKYSSTPPFFDVTQGSTPGGGSATVGWDQVSGWGVIDAWNFIHDIGPYMLSKQSSQMVNAGESTYYDIGIWFPYNWTSEMGRFIVLGLPAGVTYSTNVSYIYPAGGGIVAWVNFTITTDSNTPTGTYTLTILAYTYNHTSRQWGNLSASTIVTLVVNSAVPEFSSQLFLPLLVLFGGVLAVWQRRRRDI